MSTKKVELRFEVNGDAAAGQFDKMAQAAAKAAGTVAGLQSQMGRSGVGVQPAGTPSLYSQPPYQHQTMGPLNAPVIPGTTIPSAMPFGLNPHHNPYLTPPMVTPGGGSGNSVTKQIDEAIGHLRDIASQMRRLNQVQGTATTRAESGIKRQIDGLSQQVMAAKNQAPAGPVGTGAVAATPGTYGLLPLEDRTSSYLNRTARPTGYGLKAADGESKAAAMAEQTLGHRANRSQVMDDVTREALRKREGTKDSFGTDANISLDAVRQMMGPQGGLLELLTSRIGMGSLASAGARMSGLAARASVPLAVAGVGADMYHGLRDLEHQGGGTYGMIGRNLMNRTMVTRAVLGGFDTLRGRDTDLQIEQRDQQRREPRQQGEIDKRSMRMEIERDRSFAQNRADVLTADQRIIGMPSADRSTVLGQRAFDEAMAIRPIQQLGLTRERELAVAQRDMSGELAARDRLKAEYNKAQGNALFAEARMVGSSGVDGTKAANEFKLANDQVQRLNQELEQAERRIEQARGRVIEAKAENARTQADLMRAQADLLAGKEAKAVGQAQSIGALTPLKFQQGLDAIVRVRQQGEFAAPQDFANASLVARDEVTKIQEEIGRRRIEGLGEKAAPMGLLNVNELRAERIKVEVNLENLERQLNENVAKDIAKQLNSADLVKAFDARIQVKVDTAINDLTIKLRKDMFAK